MPPRDNELPEGTDHIINGAMSSGPATGTGGGGADAATTGGGGSGSGFIGGASQDGTGGTAAGGGSMAKNDKSGGSTATTGGTGGGTTTTTGDGGGTIGSGTRSGGTATGGGGGNDSGGGGNDSGGVVEQLRGQATALRDQAGGRVRDFAESGKTRASDALEELAKVVGDTAESIDERMGREYGEYARRAADAVSGVADTLRRQEVDELYDNVRSAVRKSPGVAIGVAAVLGFTVARLIKSGLDAGGEQTAARGNGGGKSGGKSGKSGGGSGGQA